jgi:hypothetical protein
MQEIDTHEAANDALPPAEYTLLESRGDAERAIDAVIAAARQVICVFDVHLSQRGFNAPKRVAVLQTFLAQSRDSQLRIVLHQTEKLHADAPRLIHLQKQYPMKVHIHRTLEAARHAADPLVIADDHSFWHQMQFEQPRSALQLYSAAETAPWAQRFNDIWEASETAVSPTTLGL